MRRPARTPGKTRSCRHVASLRSTPARRGKTWDSRSRLISCTVHPARRGKTIVRPVANPSPPVHPRTPGENGHSADDRSAIQRSTPARRGKTRSTDPPHAPASVHPRTPGENNQFIVHQMQQYGPPPHAGGKPANERDPPPAFRSTPARRGKTSPMAAAWRSRPVHPRTPGENATQQSADQSISSVHPRTPGENVLRWRRPGDVPAGPPPHAGGKRHEQSADQSVSRSTPARRGKTAGDDVRSQPNGPPPHAGGKLVATTGRYDHAGPPPHAGENVEANSGDGPDRSTPARRGKTRSSDALRSTARRGNRYSRLHVGPPPHAGGKL